MSGNDQDYIKQQYEVLKYSNEQFDKNVLFIASGALGISFAFIEKIIPDLSKAVSKCLLITSWYFFAGVIFISLFAHFVSIMANRWAIKHEEDESYDYGCKKWNYAIRSINVLMILGLLIGTILLIHFVKLNI